MRIGAAVLEKRTARPYFSHTVAVYMSTSFKEKVFGTKSTKFLDRDSISSARGRSQITVQLLKAILSGLHMRTIPGTGFLFDFCSACQEDEKINVAMTRLPGECD